MSDGGIKATSVRVFTPSRQVKYDFDDNTCKLSDYHTITVEPGGIRCHYISGYGPGHFFPTQTVLGGWNSCCRNTDDRSLIEPKDYQVDRDPTSTDDEGVQIYSLEKAATRKEKKTMERLHSQNLSKVKSNEERVKCLRSQGIIACPSIDARSQSHCM